MHDLNLLSNIPKVAKSRKSKLYGGRIRYYNNDNELMDRLEMLTASKKAGNTSNTVYNEAYNIIEKLKTNGKINDNQYKAYVEKYLY